MKLGSYSFTVKRRQSTSAIAAWVTHTLCGAQEPKLCCTVLQVFGRMNKTIEGVPVEEGASYVNKYFLLPTDTKSTDTITLSLNDGELEEGYYHMSAKVRA